MKYEMLFTLASYVINSLTTILFNNFQIPLAVVLFISFMYLIWGVLKD